MGTQMKEMLEDELEEESSSMKKMGEEMLEDESSSMKKMSEEMLEDESSSMKKMSEEEASIHFAQINQLRDIFSRFDMDSDGSLTIYELAAVLRSIGLKPTADQIPVLLANMDSNGNGFIEFNELVHAIWPSIDQQVLVNQEHLLEVFRLFDLDGDGLITPSELAKSMAKMGQPLSWRELTEMIKEADTDDDGVINFSEFASVMAKSVSEYLGVDMPGIDSDNT